MNVENNAVQIGDLWDIFRRRGKVVGAIALVSALAAYWIAMALPNEYQSYATVLVEPQAVDPDIVESGIAESDLAQRLHLMTAQILSRGRLSRIIDDLDLYQEESEYLVREQIIDKMREKVRVEPVIPELAAAAGTEYEISTFKILFSDDRAGTARDVAQRLANDFIESHIEARVNVSQKSLDFIEDELERLSTRIRDIEAQIATVKNDNPNRLPEDMNSNQRRLERLMSDLQFAQRRLSEAQSDEAFFRSQVASAALLESGGGDGQVSPGRRIKQLELAMADFEARGFTQKHPDIMKAKIEIDQLKAQVAGGDSDEDKPSLSFAQQNAEAEARRAGLRRSSSQDEIDRLEATIEEVQALMLDVPAVAEQLDALEREYKHLFASYQDFSNRRLEATVQAQLERRQLGEKFRVLESAFKAREPSSPNRPMIVLLGLIFGLGFAGGAAVLLEGIDQSVHNARQLQGALQLPVLASIPEIWLESDRAQQRRSRMRTAFATAALVVFVLVGGAGSYVWVNGRPGGGGGDPTPGDAAPAAETESAPSQETAARADGEG